LTEVEIPKLYVEMKDTVVKSKLAEVEFLSATTDLWTNQAKQILVVRILLRILEMCWELGSQYFKFEVTIDNGSNFVLLSTPWIGFVLAVLEAVDMVSSPCRRAVAWSVLLPV